jgi:hypothetical protein
LGLGTGVRLLVLLLMGASRVRSCSSFDVVTDSVAYVRGSSGHGHPQPGTGLGLGVVLTGGRLGGLAWPAGAVVARAARSIGVGAVVLQSRSPWPVTAATPIGFDLAAG